MNKQTMYARMLMLMIVTNDVSAYVELIGAGATAPVGVYIPWMAAYRSLRAPFVDIRLSYSARGSGFGKRAITARTVHYAGSDSLLSEVDYQKNPGLQMFPSVALSVSRYFYLYGRFFCILFYAEFSGRHRKFRNLL